MGDLLAGAGWSGERLDENMMNNSQMSPLISALAPMLVVSRETRLSSLDRCAQSARHVLGGSDDDDDDDDDDDA